MSSTSISDKQRQSEEITQAGYKETPYEDADWEVIGTYEPDDSFFPMKLKVSSEKRVTVDPMFADYGGIPTSEDAERLHQPEGSKSYKKSRTKKSKELEEEEKEAGIVRVKQQELEDIKKQAFAEGQQLAIEQALDDNQKKLETLQQSLHEVIRDMTTQLQQNIENLEKEAVKLAMNISKKILTFAIDINPEYIAGLTKEALQHCGAATIKKVRVSPQDMEFIKIVGISRDVEGYDGSWQFEADQSIQAGCVVETSAGEVDFQLDKAWERLQDKVVKILK